MRSYTSSHKHGLYMVVGATLVLACAAAVPAAITAQADSQIAPPLRVTSANNTLLANQPNATQTIIWVDGNNGNNDTNDGAASEKSFKTIEKALEKHADLCKNNPNLQTTINIKHAFTLAKPVTIPSGVTLNILKEGATITCANEKSNDGLVLASGATLKGEGELTMSKFKTALTAEKGSLITDGTYKFTDNAVKEGRGIYLAGTVKGSAGKDTLKITADDAYNTNFYESGITFENCTINVTSKTRTWFDARDLTLKNASLTVKGFGMTYYMNKLSMEDSDLTINQLGWYHPTGMNIQAASTIKNSHITVNAGSTAGISVGINGTDNTVTVENSTLEFNNTGTGGLNVNTGCVKLINSTIKGNGKQSGALFGAQQNGTVEFGENCLVETPSEKDADNGAAQTGGHYIVTGGSYRVTYAPKYHSTNGSTIPVNGDAHGNEPLSLFTLSDASVTELKPIDKNGKTYTYQVKKASTDNKKHVWVPAAKVTFKLNAPDTSPVAPAAGTPATNTKVDASYPDGTKDDKEALAMRGYALSAAADVAGGNTLVPADPIAFGYEFLGWYYNDKSGAEQKFDAKTVVTTDTVVYAKWKENPFSYGITYHNGQTPDVTFLHVSGDVERKATVLSYSVVAKEAPNFTPKGKVFKRWTTKPQGQGDAMNAGSKVSIPAGAKSVDLYAEWEDQVVSVKFSANGGVFAQDSVFKTKTDVFDIVQDEDGGEVAVVKKKPKANDNIKLSALLSSLNKEVTNKTAGIAGTTTTKNDEAYTKLAAREDYTLVSKTTTSGWIFTTTYYNYWFSDKNEEKEVNIGNDVTLDKDTTFYLHWKLNDGVDKVEATTNLPSDLLVGTETQHKEPYPVSQGQKVDFTGAIVAKSVKDQMSAIETQFGEEKDYEHIALSHMHSTFVATLKVPEGMTLPSQLTAPMIKTEGFGDVFTVSNVETAGNTVKVTLKLKDGITTYAQLQDAVKNQLGDTMKLTIPGVKVNDDAPIGAKLTVDGSVDGTFSARAVNKTGSIKHFSFTWNGVQTQDGMDSTAKSVNDGIRFTVIVKKNDKPAPNPEPEPNPTPNPEPAPEPNPTPNPVPSPAPNPTPNPEPEPTPNPEAGLEETPNKPAPARTIPQTGDPFVAAESLLAIGIGVASAAAYFKKRH